ncbi:DUF2207 domain-containing protein [Bifidobacterium sp. ESL0682]|uniref:DUF2207 domain-containing protein n=1 Tax=Bifidobacterium sp. ESL0682 TaxID=2983212 RepID=UPI0023F6B897|nr:DUF2207 domain-containing protein [Bifidobacterium sp. ESL0682]WEV41750.1 DUF2207 domain-containing protein [Bifidobacterium sp. ESL0682]
MRRIRQGLNGERIVAALKAAVIGTLVVVVFLALCSFQSGDLGFHRADMIYHSLNYDVSVRPDGDLRITEHVDMKLNKRKGGKPWRQLFQRYTIQHNEKSDGILSAITDVSVTNVSTGQKFRHGDGSSTRDLYSPNWNEEYAGEWYAVALANTHSNEGDEYLPAAMNGDQYRQKTAELKQASENHAPGTQNQREQAGTQTNGNIAAAPDSAKTGNARDGEDAASDAGSSQLRDENGAAASMGKSGDTVEIGWNIPATKSAKSLKFDVSMTFKDVVKVYNDVAYFKWEPVGDNSGVPIDDFRAKVTLPQGVKSADTRQWMHYTGKGSVAKSGGQQIEITAHNVAANRHIDLVSMFSASPMSADVVHRIAKDGKSLVLGREAAEQRKAADDVTMRRNVILGYLGWEGAALLFALAAVLITNWQAYYPDEHPRHGVSHSKKKKTRKKKLASGSEPETGQVPYSQDIPDITPTNAAKFIDYLDFGEYSDSFKSRQMSSTLLSLVSKGVIAVYPGRSEWFKGIDLSNASDDEIAQRLRDVSEMQKKNAEFAAASAGKADEKVQRTDREAQNEECIKRARSQGLAKGMEAVREVIADEADDRINSSKPTSTVVMLPGSFADSVGETHGLTATERALLNLLRAISLKLDTPVFDFHAVGRKLDGWWKAEWLQSVFNWTANFEYLKLRVVKPLLFGFAAAVAIVVAGVMGALYVDRLAFNAVGSGTDDYGHVSDQLHGQWGVSLLLGVPVIFLLIFLFKLLRYSGLTRKGRRLAAPMLGLEAYLRHGGDSTVNQSEAAGSVVMSGSGSISESGAGADSGSGAKSNPASVSSDSSSTIASNPSPVVPLSPDTFDKYYIYATALGVSTGQMQRFGGLFSSLDDKNGRGNNDSLCYWYRYSTDSGSAMGTDSSLGAQFSDFAAGISNGIDTMESTFSTSSGSDGGSGGGGSFGGSGGGSGGGSFGGR